MINEPMSKKIDTFYCIAGSILFIICGAMIIQEWDSASYKTATQRVVLAKGSLAIVNGFLFMLDVFFAYRDSKIMEPVQK